MKVRGTFTPPNAQATDGLGRCQREASLQNKQAYIQIAVGLYFFGGPGRTRTYDQGIMSPLL